MRTGISNKSRRWTRAQKDKIWSCKHLVGASTAAPSGSVGASHHITEARCAEMKAKTPRGLQPLHVLVILFSLILVWFDEFVHFATDLNLL